MGGGLTAKLLNTLELQILGGKEDVPVIDFWIEGDLVGFL